MRLPVLRAGAPRAMAPAAPRARPEAARPARVLFIEVDTERPWAVASIGPACLAAYLRGGGHEVDFLRARIDMSTEEVIEQALRARPDLIGLSLTSRQWLRARGLVAQLRRRLDVPVVAGGLHPTFAPEAVLAAPGFDYVCLGEGEGPLLDLAGALLRGERPEGIANLWVRGGARPPLREPVSPIDDLPFLARDLLDEHPGVVHMATQRGCPFPCTYCAANMYEALYEDVGKYGRRRSCRSVLDELHGLHREWPLSYVIFLDDTFTIHHPWVRAFCRGYGEELGVPFSLHARVETVSEPLLALLAGAGCRQITYGVESGSERVRREVMRRPVTSDRFRDVFRWTRQAGIAITANYMLGLPGETREDLERTLELAEELSVLDFGYSVFYPFPGTHLFQHCRERGYLPEDYLERPANHRESILRLPDLSQDDIREFYDRFTALRGRLSVERLGEAPDAGGPAGAVEQVEALAGTG